MIKEKMYDIPTAQLEAEAVDFNKLSNFVDIATGCDCPMDDSTPRSVMENEFPLATWLLNTSLSRLIRRRFDLEHVTQTDNGWEMKIPGTFWSLLPEDTGEECCWVPLNFDKCCSTSPLNLLCLKDCDSIFNRLVKRDLQVTSKNAMQGIARAGESVETVERRIARLSFAFFQAHTAILGMDDTYANPLKPFHGLMQVLENPAIIELFAFDIIGVFEELACRLDVLGYNGDYVIALHPMTYGAIDSVIVRGQTGEYPAGWSRGRNGELYFKGIRFIRDKRVPVNTTNMTGEAWLLDGNSVGLFMASNFMVTDRYIRESGVDTSEDSCGAECTYYYNYGGAFANNSNRLAKIVGIPLNSACERTIADLEGLIVPQTLIPSGVVA